MMKLNKLIFKKLGYIAQTLAFIGLATSCADDLSVDSPSIPENSIAIELLVPENEQVTTRADEFSVADLTIFIFNEDGTAQLCSPQVFNNLGTSATSNSANITLKLPGKAFSANKRIYAVANAKDKLTGTYESISDLEDITLTDLSVTLSEGLVMAGKSETVNANVNSMSLTLKRVAATMKVAFNGVTGYTLSGFKAGNTANGAYMGAATNAEKEFYSPATNSVSASGTDAAYLYPSKANSATDESEAAYVILKASPSDSPSTVYNYYLSLKEKGVDIEPNHEYTIEILAIRHAGFTDENDAIAHPEDGWNSVDYRIYDRLANVTSMVSDGIRELGMTYDFTYDESKDNYITVKYYSPVASEYPSNFEIGQAAMPEIISGSNWLQIENGIEDNNYSGNQTNDPNTETQGISKKFKIEKKSGVNITATTTAVIRVKWMGLERTVKVTYKTDFSPKSLCSVNLYIKKDWDTPLTYYSDGTAQQPDLTIADYWDFISQKGTSIKEADTSTQKLYGVSETEMGPGMERNQGIHLPMPYGSNMGTSTSEITNFWRYEYVLDFNGGTTFKPKATVEKAYIEGDPDGITEAVLNDGNYNFGAKGMVLVRLKKNNYNYWTGTLKAVVNDTEVSFNIYHTGFFHYHGNNGAPESHSVTPAGETKDYGYYYYEVAQLEGRYWLDRNLGAKSRGMYIQTDANTSLLGSNVWPANNDARGNYYQPAKYYNETSGSNTPYDNPEKHIYSSLCPPGYRLPRKAEWDKLRLSSTFNTGYISENGLNFYDASYVSENGAGTIYFPKSRYYNDGFVGSSEGGYYWTGSKATGMEKVEIGKWMRALNISGANTTFVYGDISKFYMNVRPIQADGSTNDPEFTLSFNVKGATNVYLYTYSSIDGQNVKTPLETWPGKGVADSSTASAGKVMNFSYNTTINPDAEEIYVIFTYVENGITKVLCSDGEGLGSTSTSISEAKGWKYKRGGNYYFLDPKNNTSKDASGWEGIIFE